ncbi:MAG: nickel pincer cofactor biosynthesis protein LarB [Gammaproteobacteria bacterium]|nr:nickel pincer cofactor biosynthesis protein LarB [Gammaproteobacteria bacterium]MYC25889.1 nickel pincer cofactor biosynthesis protein LarB [Gammaproteobacteria bacterium]
MSDLEQILQEVRAGKLAVDVAMAQISEVQHQTIESTTIDHTRAQRTGTPEVIYGEYKTPQQVLKAFELILGNGNNTLATRLQPEAAELLLDRIDGIVYVPEARIAYKKLTEPQSPTTHIGAITAGTSDLSVAEEAAITAEFYGNVVERVFDVGVAGVHRLFSRLEIIRSCRVLIVVAGMEGALPSVVGGLVDKPVIAVPTSVGYGASFQGIAALLGMLTSCASGVSVVNIDNGFGAGFLANLVNRL